MLSNQLIEQELLQFPTVSYAKVTGDGYHFDLIIVSSEFEGKKKLNRQQWVYGLLKDKITSGALHAITMSTYTQEEWESR